MQAAAFKRRIAEQHGHVVEIDGTVMRAFPSPERLVGVLGELRLHERKRTYLAAFAAAARGGALDGKRLRASDPQAAIAELQELPGIGPFSAELIIVRGANHPDVLPRHEDRLTKEMAEAYQRPDPSQQELADIASRWRPYRAWAAVHLRARREERNHEIAGPFAADRTVATDDRRGPSCSSIDDPAQAIRLETEQ